MNTSPNHPREGTIQGYQYQPEIWSVRKDDIREAILAIESGLEYTKAALMDHECTLGRDHPKNKRWAEAMEKDIVSIEATLAKLKKYSATTMPA